MVEKLRETWYQYIPSWLPVILAILTAAWWVSGTVTGMQHDIKSLQDQMKDLQEYVREGHVHAQDGPSHY